MLTFCARSSLAEREKDGKQTCRDTIVVLLGITIIPPYALLASQTHSKRAIVNLAFREQINLFWYSILPIRIIPVTSTVIYVPYPLFLSGKWEATILKSSSRSHLFYSYFRTRYSTYSLCLENRFPIHTPYSCFGSRFIMDLVFYYGPGSIVGIATDYGLDGPGIESQWGGGIFRTCPNRPWGPPSLLSFPRVKSGRGVTLNPHPLLVPWS